MERATFVKDLWDYPRIRKKMRLLPLMALLPTLGLLILFTEGDVLSPLIYILY